MLSHLRPAVAAALVVASTMALAAPTRYTATLLPDPKGGFLTGAAMSTTAATGITTNNAHTNQQGWMMTPDGTYTALAIPGAVYVVATAINKSDQIVGSYETDSIGSGFLRAPDGTLTDLDMDPHGINDGGTVVGVAYSGSIGLPAMWKNGVLTLLPTLGFGDASYGNGVAAINKSGTMAGFVATGVEGVTEAATWKNGVLTELPTLSAYGHGAAAISSNGLVAGTCGIPDGGSSRQGACLWKDGAVVNLGTLVASVQQATASGVNAAGTVVGRSWANDRDGYHAFIYAAGQMLDLNTLTTLPTGNYLNGGVAIDDAGNILATGFGTDAAHPQQAHPVTFLLRPVR